jgi:hypothetical protein
MGLGHRHIQQNVAKKRIKELWQSIQKSNQKGFIIKQDSGEPPTDQPIQTPGSNKKEDTGLSDDAQEKTTQENDYGRVVAMSQTSPTLVQKEDSI